MAMTRKLRSAGMDLEQWRVVHWVSRGYEVMML